MEKPLSIVERMEQLALQQKREKFTEKQAGITTVTCPNCGSGRAKDDGLTRCAYCGFEFIKQTLSNGVHIKDRDNSK
ncbi:hypothetical protein RYH73_18735 [Olivibacter sp. CPCC 100613]|uniref:hypothetical protein n=1 Tax=Olivibacter sp. CPCC 100613 TaxID=3079931 RepID=UPI002FFA4EDC